MFHSVGYPRFSAPGNTAQFPHFSGKLTIVSHNADKLNTEGKKKALKEVIIQESANMPKQTADIVILQETGGVNELIDFVIRYLNSEYKIVIDAPSGPNAGKEQAFLDGARLHQAILYKKDRLKQEDVSETFDQTRPGDKGKKRPVLGVKLFAGDFPIHILSAHFRAKAINQQGVDETLEVRKEEAEDLTRIIQKLVDSDPETPILIGADLNSRPDNPRDKEVLNILEQRHKEPQYHLFETSLKSGDTDERLGSTYYKPNIPKSKSGEQGWTLDYQHCTRNLKKLIQESGVLGVFANNHEKKKSQKPSPHLFRYTVIEDPRIPDASPGETEKALDP